MRRPDPIPELKARIADEITTHLDGWSQEMAAEWIGTDQPRMSDLRKGRLTRFSLARLVRFATRIGATVRVDVEWPEGWWGPAWRERPPVPLSPSLPRRRRPSPSKPEATPP